jgi:hypothetical protein
MSRSRWKVDIESWIFSEKLDTSQAVPRALKNRKTCGGGNGGVGVRNGVFGGGSVSSQFVNISPIASRISLNTQPDCVVLAPIDSSAQVLHSQTETTMIHCHTHRHDALPRGHPALLVAPALRQPRRPVEHAAGRRKLVVGREAREKGLGIVNWRVYR